ncbi:MAG: CPBP family intramembrane glutamic endopeptidase [bacterium]
MKETTVSVFNDLREFITSRFSLYTAFFSLWTLFLLYNNNFFYPFYFWIVFSTLVLFTVPVLFIITVEENSPAVKILYFIFTLLAVIFAFYLISLNGSKRDFSKNELINVLLIFSILPIIAYMLFTRKFILSGLGFSFGKAREALIVTLVCSVCAAAIAYFASFNPQFTKIYPMIRAMKNGGWTFFQYELGFLFFFFLWEFYFRGAMLFSFSKSAGSISSAVLMQSVIFAFAHIGKPGIETVSSLFGGILLGFLVYRIRTFAPAAVIHFVLAFTMDVISVFFKKP